MADGGGGNQEPQPADAAKDALVARIKRNFLLETQAFRRRISDATDEAARARERVDSAQEQLQLAQTTCRRLRARLAERDATIRFLSEQQQQQQSDGSDALRLLPALAGVQRHLDDNQQLDAQPLSISKARERAESRAAVDERFHEYETQIAQLYAEIQDEKQKNETLGECLREQKHSKAKLMKACRLAKQEVEALKNNGMAQLLDDLQGRCQAQEAENERLGAELAREKAQASGAHESAEQISRQLELLRASRCAWEDAALGKDAELATCRAQIRAQQELIENQQLDMREIRARRSSFGDHPVTSDDTREERDLLVRALQAERTRLSAAEHEVRELRTKSEALERQLYASSESAARSTEPGDAAAPPTSANLRDLLKTTRELRRKVDVLSRLLATYKETDTIDLQLLAAESWRDGADNQRRECDGDSTESDERRLRRELLLAKRSVSELQAMVEDACATAMGNACALQ